MNILENTIDTIQYLEINEIDETNKYENSLEILSAALGKNDILSGYCSKCSKDGDLTIDFGDIKCTMLRNEVTPILEEDGFVHKVQCQNKVGNTIKFRVIKYENNKFYLSRKSVVNEIREQYNSTLQVGMLVKGVITNIDENIGCFVDIGGDYIAMLPKRFLEYVFVNRITDHVSQGEVIEAVIQEIDKKENQINKITLSRVETLPPYEKLISEFESGDIVIGTVNQITPKSVFCQLTKHLNITCRLSNNVRVVPGQKVRIKVKRTGTSIDKRLVGEIISVL